jgi:elongation factor G
MKTYDPNDVRAVGYFGHRGSGKTSLIEGMLYSAGVTNRLGSVDKEVLTLESDPDAIGRHTTMSANVGTIEWNGTRIGVVDTPGDGNFWGTTHRVFDVIDSAVVTVSAVDGVEPMALRAIQELEQRHLPFAIVVNKLDKDGANFESTLAELAQNLHHDSVPVSVPIVNGELQGVASLLSGKAYLADGDAVKEAPIPEEIQDAMQAAREKLFDAVAAADDELAERFLEQGVLSPEDLARGLRAAFHRGDLIPILVANPVKNIGTTVLLDLIRSTFPSPIDRPTVHAFRDPTCSEEIELLPAADGPLVARVFHTHYDPFSGMLSYARVLSGKIAASHDVWNPTASTSDRPSHMFLPQGGTKNGVEVKEAMVGDIIALTKLKHTHTGDTLCSKEQPAVLPKFEEPEALLSYGISVGDHKAEEKLAQAIHRIMEEDPSIVFMRDSESKETILGGLGQAHIDHVVDYLKRAGIEVQLREPKIPYRETFRAGVQMVEGKHKKQTGGSGQYGICYIDMEPLPRGSGVVFEDKIVGGAIPRNFIPSVEKGVRDALKKGPIAGSPVVDVKVSLVDGKYHRVDSSDIAFQMAGRKAIRELYKAKAIQPVLLEPLMHLDIVCPAETVGDVMGDLNSRRARVENMATEGKRGIISASAPMAEMLKYTNVLKSITRGQGSFTMRFEKYEEAPPPVQKEVAARYTDTSEVE